LVGVRHVDLNGEAGKLERESLGLVWLNRLENPVLYHPTVECCSCYIYKSSRLKNAQNIREFIQLDIDGGLGDIFMFFYFFFSPEIQSFDHSAYAQCKQSLTACLLRISRVCLKGTVS
jgi:hypothetical protein